MISMFLMSSMTVFAEEADYAGESGFGIWAIIVPFIIALIVCFVMYSNMKSVHKATSAREYEKENSFKLNEKSDVYTHTTTQRIHHESNNSK